MKLKVHNSVSRKFIQEVYSIRNFLLNEIFIDIDVKGRIDLWRDSVNHISHKKSKRLSEGAAEGSELVWNQIIIFPWKEF